MIRHDAFDIAGMPLSSYIRPCYVQIGNFSTFMRAERGTRERAARTERAEGPPATRLATLALHIIVSSAHVMVSYRLSIVSTADARDLNRYGT